MRSCERFRPGQPLSGCNKSHQRTDRSITWANETLPNHLAGITGFRFDESISAEDQFLAELDAIDPHHGPH